MGRITVEVIVFELSNFVEDVFQGFKVLYNMESKLCGFYIIWKGNFVGRITVEVVLYLNYPTLWNSMVIGIWMESRLCWLSASGIVGVFSTISAF